MPSMENDNIYPNSSETFFGIGKEPTGQVEARERKDNETLSAIPLLNETVKHFDEQIAFLNSVDSIHISIESDSEKFQKAFEVNRMTRDFLIKERDYIVLRTKNAKR